MADRTYDQLKKSLKSEFGELLSSHEGEVDLSDFEPYRDDPIGFIREVLGGEPWEEQVRIAEAVREHPQVTVRSCHAAGKDWLAARLALWWVYARRGLVVLTGPTATQVQEILMRGEVRDAFSRAGHLPGSLHVNALRPGGEGRAGILAKTATGVSALTGFHDARVLFVITEAQDPEIDHAWDAAFAVATGAEDRIVTLGNPVAKEGRFYRAHRPGSDWHALKVPASAIPNVREGETIVPGLLTREGVDRFASEYGEESGFYVSRVLAEFPDEAEDALFRRDWLEAAAQRWAHRERWGSKASEAIPVAALDPARHGPDDSVLAIRRGDVVDDLVVWEGRHDTTELAKGVAWALEERGFRADGSKVERVRLIVDEVGLGGGVLDKLREMGWTARGFNGGRKAVESDRFFNRRAESYWILRDRLEEDDLGLVWSDDLVQELLAVRWRATPAGKVQLEAKRDMTSRLGRSPDRADALAMALYPWRHVGKSGAQGKRPRAKLFTAG